MQRDIEYIRNDRPDTLLPDVFMVSDFPRLVLHSDNPPLPESLLPEKSEPTPEYYVIEAPLSLDLPIPVIFPRPVDQKLSGLTFNVSGQTGGDFLLNQSLPGISSSLFLAGAYEKDEDFPAWLSGGYHYQEGPRFLLRAAGRMNDEKDLYALGAYKGQPVSEGRLVSHSLSLFMLQPDAGDFSFLPRIESSAVLNTLSWQPSLGLAAEGLIGSGYNSCRYRPSVGFAKGWIVSESLEWYSALGLAMEYRTDSGEISYYPEGTLSFVTGRDFSFFLTIGRDDFDDENRILTGLREDHPAGLLQLTGWLDGGGGFSGQFPSWDYYCKGGVKRGDFLRIKDDVFLLSEETVPYGELQVSFKKKSKAVSDILFHAEYLNKRDLQYRLENNWYLPDKRWSLGIHTGHYGRYDENYASLVGNENLLYGLFTAFKGETVDLVRLFMNYYPEEERLDGGISLLLSYE